MKFKDIEKFTQTPNYHVDVPLDHLNDRIEKHIDEFNLQLNPDFQRGHVWTESQQIAYIEYLLRGGTSGKEIYLNMPGWMGSWEGDFVCVDGLQRITACLKFLNNEIPAFNCYLENYEDKMRIMDICLSFNINNLKTRKEVLIWYIEMNSGGTIHTDDEINRVKQLITESEK